ncbi:MAG: HepT-like ribonuclease domain-containing protein [Phycisphaerae bacterium]
MPLEVPKWLEDIRDAGAFILSATSGKTFDGFVTDRLLRQAVERNFEIIGEALSRLTRTDEQTAHRISHAKRIIAFRNILIHGYDHIDLEVVWNVVQNNLPELVAQVESLLREVENSP